MACPGVAINKQKQKRRTSQLGSRTPDLFATVLSSRRVLDPCIFAPGPVAFLASRKFTAASGTLSTSTRYVLHFAFCCLLPLLKFHFTANFSQDEKQLLSRMLLRCGNRNRLFLARKNQSQLVGSTCALCAEHFTQWLIAILVSARIPWEGNGFFLLGSWQSAKDLKSRGVQCGKILKQL